MSQGNPHPVPFQKTGADANPHGRPKREWTVQGMIEDAMEEMSIDKKQARKIVYTKLVEMAMAGDIQAIKEVNNRLDGMPQQKTDITSNGEGLTPLLVRFLGEEKHEDTPSDGDTK